MRSILILGMFTASLASAAWADYEEVRDLTLSANGMTSLAIEAGAGSLEILGVSGASEISVSATIHVPKSSEEAAREMIRENMVLDLQKDGGRAVLKGFFNSNSSRDHSPSIRLVVHVPQQFSLDVKDGSGSITIEDVSGDLEVDDGSGSISMRDVGGDVRIDDGSGSISVKAAGKNVSVLDGSGSIKIRDVGGSVTIDDGSGSISVDAVEQDLIIVDDGSGSLNYSDIKGRVEKET